ncbi:MAG: hypothetical protein QOD74_2111 [Variibacter sp.]|nr:hypothetical protein [Variibacter sp.]
MSPIRQQAPPPWPLYEEDEINAVVRVLRSGNVNQWTGDLVSEFEEKFAQRMGMLHAVAVSSGSIALELALRAFGIGAGDEVIVTSRSFIASASCVNLVGATPVFADVDYETGLLSPATIEPHIGRRTKAIIPVHLYGRPCDMPAIMALAGKSNLIVIEDCAQSLGASINGHQTGSFGHGAAFSFCRDKIMSTGGEGGMILFGDPEVRDRAWALKDHGKPRSLAKTAQPNNFEFRWCHERIGTNGRMLELQAAIGLVQLNKLEGWLSARQRIAERYTGVLSRFPMLKVAAPRPGERHAYYRFEFRVESGDPQMNRDKLVRELNAEGIKAFTGICPEIYREPVYLRTSSQQRRPNAARLAETSATVLSHHTLDEQYFLDCEQAFEKILG